MGLALLDVADIIRPHSEVVTFLEHVDNGGFLDELATLAGGCESRDAIRTWLDNYGTCEALGLSCPAAQTPARFLRNPPNRAWARGLRLRAEVEIQCSTVHEARGKQFDAVVLVIPPDRAPANHTMELFTAWESGTELEAKRVVYVAVTRARRLVVLAIPSAYLMPDDSRVGPSFV